MDIIAAYREAGTYRGGRPGRGTRGEISAKRLLPAARAAGYAGSPLNFRLVAGRSGPSGGSITEGRHPAVWSPGEHLVIDWGSEGGLHVFCAVLAWCWFRFVQFAVDERAGTALALLAECFEVLGGAARYRKNPGALAGPPDVQFGCEL